MPYTHGICTLVVFSQAYVLLYLLSLAVIVKN